MYNSLKDFSIENKKLIVQEVKNRNLNSLFNIVPSDFYIEDLFKYDKIKIDRLHKKVIKEFFINFSILESKIPYNKKFAVLEPFTFDSNSIIDINKAAKKIATYLSLSNYTFIITPTNLDERTAGIIEINSQREVFIEVSKEIIKFNNILLATIAHEIVHQFLNINNIRFKDTIANERLTDLTCVYLGLGKIMLNGLWEEVYDLNYKYSAKAGYLNLSEIAFILNIIFTRYNNSKRDLLNGLDGQKSYLILKTNSSYDFF